MSDSPTPPHPTEPLTADERDWAARLARIGPHDGPSPALDARILASARSAAAIPARHRSLRQGWPTLVGAAASLVVVVGLAWQSQLFQRTRPALDESAAPPSALPSSDGSLTAEVLTKAAPMAERAVDGPPPNPVDVEAVRSPTRPAADLSAPSGRTDTANASGGSAVARDADPAGKRPARQAATRPVAGEAAVGPADVDGLERSGPPPSPFPAALPQMDGGFPPPAAPQPATATRSKQAPLPMHSGAADALPAPASNAAIAETHGANRSAELARLPVREDTRLEPEAWLRRIRDRRDAGDAADARESLALFRRHHPHASLPADLQRLGP